MIITAWLKCDFIKAFYPLCLPSLPAPRARRWFTWLALDSVIVSSWPPVGLQRPEHSHIQTLLFVSCYWKMKLKKERTRLFLGKSMFFRLWLVCHYLWPLEKNVCCCSDHLNWLIWIFDPSLHRFRITICGWQAWHLM